MKKENKTPNWIVDGIAAIIGIIILLVITQFMCSRSNEFCSYEYKIFAVILVIALFAIRYFLNKKN